MTAEGDGGGRKPPPDLPDDPLLRPASDDGWEDERPSAAVVPAAAPPLDRPAVAAAPPKAEGAAPSLDRPAAAAASRQVSTFPVYVPPAAPSPTTAVPPSTAPATSHGSGDATLHGTAPPGARGTAPPGPLGAPPRSATSASSAIAPGATVASPAVDEPLLPTSYHENDLRSAAGVSPLPDAAAMAATGERRSRADDEGDDEPPRSPRNRKAIAASAVSIVVGLAIAAVVFVGRANSDRYLLACEAERAVPQQGRGFPPWGTRALDGEAWRPLKIAPETRCKPHETDDVRELQRLYLAMIVDAATGLLTAREVTRLDEAEGLLKQALLLTRPPERESEKLAAERSERHQEIERLLGDVTYWRASAKLRDAAAALGDAAKQFDTAAEQRPRHMSDARAWATHARKLAQDLETGPAGATQPTAPSTPGAPGAAATEPSGAPPGVALPVEPGAGSASEPPPPTTPDAGVPSGGVLL